MDNNDKSQNQTITIPKSEYYLLKEDALFLQCLRSMGVDNWEFYEGAIDLFEESL